MDYAFLKSMGWNQGDYSRFVENIIRLQPIIAPISQYSAIPTFHIARQRPNSSNKPTTWSDIRNYALPNHKIIPIIQT